MKKLIIALSSLLIGITTYSQTGISLGYIVKPDIGNERVILPNEFHADGEISFRLDYQRKNRSLLASDLLLYAGVRGGARFDNNFKNEYWHIGPMIKGYSEIAMNLMVGLFAEYDIINEDFSFGVPVMYIVGNNVQLTADLYMRPATRVEFRFGLKYSL